MGAVSRINDLSRQKPYVHSLVGPTPRRASIVLIMFSETFEPPNKCALGLQKVKTIHLEQEK